MSNGSKGSHDLNLNDVVARWGPVPVATAVDWMLQAAEAIAEAHSQGIAHGDITRATLILTRRPDGSAYVRVLGIHAIESVAGLDGGDGGLSSPAGAFDAGTQVDVRADVWALGVVLHELLTGQAPFQGEAQLPTPLTSVRPSVPPAIEAAVLCCLEREPAARFANLADLARAIAPFGTTAARESCTRIEGVLAPGDGPGLGEEGGGRASDLSFPPMPAEGTGEEWPSDAYLTARRETASLRAAFGGVLLLAALGVAALLWMYSAMHPELPREREGVTAAQPRASASARAARTTAETPKPAPKQTGTPAETPTQRAAEPPSATATATPTPIPTPTPPPTAAPTPTPTAAPSTTPRPTAAPTARAKAAAPPKAVRPLPRPARLPSIPVPTFPTSRRDEVPPPLPTAALPAGDDLFSGRK
jgi:serine/threonine-protein kinase